MLSRSAVLLLFGCLLRAQTASPAPDIGAAWAAEWSAKRLDDVMTMYTPDAVFFATDGGHFAGPARFAISSKRLWRPMTPLFICIARLSTNRARWPTRAAAMRKPLSRGDASTNYKGDYLLVLRKENGHWLIAEQMFTGSPVR